MQWLHRLLRDRRLDGAAEELGGTHDVGGWFRPGCVRLVRGGWHLAVDRTADSVTGVVQTRVSGRALVAWRIRGLFRPLLPQELVIRPASKAGGLVDLALGIPRVQSSGPSAEHAAVWAEPPVDAGAIGVLEALAPVERLDSLHTWEHRDGWSLDLTLEHGYDAGPRDLAVAVDAGVRALERLREAGLVGPRVAG